VAVNNVSTLPTTASVEVRRAVVAMFTGVGAAVTVAQSHSRPWASITFSGERHRLQLCVTGPGAASVVETLLDGIGHRDILLRGHILADIEVVSVEHGLDGRVHVIFEALTVEDA
jgi:hypothetical protein